MSSAPGTPSVAARARHARRVLRTALVGVDVVTLTCATGAASLAEGAFGSRVPTTTGSPGQLLVGSAALIALTMALFWMHGRFELENSLVGPREYAQIGRSLSLGVLLVAALSFFATEHPFVSRVWLALFWVSTILFVSAGRFCARRFVHRLHRRGALQTRVVIVGASSLGVALAEQFQSAEDEGIKVVGFLDEYVPLSQPLAGVPVLGRPGDLITRFDADLADEYIFIPQALPYERAEEITRLMISRSDPIVRMAVSSTDLLTRGFVIAERSRVPLLTLQRARLSGVDLLMKRAMDIVGAGVGLVVLAPLCLGAVSWQALTGSRRPWMRLTVYAADGRPTALWLLGTDTKTWLPVRGAPALISVLRGRLSLVGPRPTAYEPGRALPTHLSLTAMRPGLTGPWRLGRPGATLQDQAMGDLTYVRNYSIWEDLRILWHSGRRLVRPRHAEANLGRWQSRAALESASECAAFVTIRQV